MPLGKCFTISVILMGCAAAVQAQNMTTAQYVNTYKNIAIEEERRTGIPAAITLAQGVVESQSGNCWLVLNSNNHFGIKCKNNWTGPYVTYDDDAKGECFRKYESAADSYKDHSAFLTGNPRYATLFKIDQHDYKSWAYGLKQAGYATSPTYPQQLIKVIEDNNLNQYTLIALNEAPGNGELSDPLAPVSYGGKRGRDYALGNSPIDKSNHTTYNAPSKNYIVGAVVKVNGRKALFAKAGTPLIQVATKYDVRLSNLVKYNDLEDDQSLPQDMLVFLQKKSKRGQDDYHLVAPGETMHDVAQAEGIQMKWLRRRNKMDEGQEPAPGAKLVLDGFASEKPAVRTDVAATPLKEEDQQPKDLQPKKIWNDLKEGVNNIRNGGASTTATTAATPAPAPQQQVNKLPAGMEDDLKKVAQVNKIPPAASTLPAKPQASTTTPEKPEGSDEAAVAIKETPANAGAGPSAPVVTTPMATPPPAAAPGNMDANGYHEVTPKETLYGIAQRFNVSIANLQAWNNLQGYDIKIGQRILVRK
ncbi:Flagellum-specific peptidoglycan hydrolase FlgJ [Chitinophaga costaii]|uniref:Peptidoglycan hydrolase n=1 Tax=Chitinophaga costaii TaxID=1335309 RepID=A0A1C4BZ15_9BACT|nr:glucosaminidase domain-containing protein [Chitinophaga costaii]SCC12129.1 Flagellum-specific peptidoglycan hydrolase FlgJ [Chitinophaga costaii]